MASEMFLSVVPNAKEGTAAVMRKSWMTPFITEAVRKKWFAVIITFFDTCHRMVEPSPAWYFSGLVTKTIIFADFSRIDVKGCVFNKRTIKVCVSFC